MKRLKVHNRFDSTSLRFSAKDPSRALQQLALPLRDLVGMHIELLRQLRQRLLSSIAAKATFALNAAVWFRRGRLLICFPLPGHLTEADKFST